ncbi:hypothetical protein ACGFK1_28215 [Mycobacterium sp. NPDC048908]|uniref:hypothetical protein n=1 Tax=Mycobacterium sp. NPDC048908 TaxID=3364292 RepID=UPI00371B9E8E
MNWAARQEEGSVRWVLVAVMIVGFSTLAIGTADAQPTPSPAPGPATTSTSDELADMVMDAIQHGSAAAPTTTAVPAPPR